MIKDNFVYLFLSQFYFVAVSECIIIIITARETSYRFA